MATEVNITIDPPTKADVGLGNVDNTADIDKPVSEPQQEALDLKYDASNPSEFETPDELDARDTANRDRANHTGTQTATTISDFDSAAADAAPVQSVAGKTGDVSLVKGDVGLGDVPNLDTTAAVANQHTHTNKTLLDSITEAFTTALKTAYDSAASWITTNGASVIAHLSRTDNPHSVTKTQVGLSNADNTSDANKPISTAAQTALDLKLNKLSKNSWATLPATPIVAPAATPHRIVPFWEFGGQTGALNTTAGRVDFFPFMLQQDMTVARLGAYCTAIGAGTVETGIYDNLNGRPNTRLLTSGAISVAATTGFKELAGQSLALTKDTLYWMAIVYTGGTIKSISGAAGMRNIQGITESGTSTTASFSIVGLSQSATSALPATAVTNGVVSSYGMYLYIATS